MTAPSAEDVHRRLSLLRVAKDVFLSDWYLRAADALVSPEGRAVLRRIAEESAKERDEALALVEEWAREPGATEATEHGVKAMQATMARDFLDNLISIKQASADVFQKAGMMAPAPLKERFYELANVDVVHAMEIRRLILSEFPEPDQLFLYGDATLRDDRG